MITSAQKLFFKSKKFAVVGASNDPKKFGNKLLKWYMERNLTVIPVNNKVSEIEGIETKTLGDITNPESVSISIVVPPSVTAAVVKEAADLGFKNVWMQPGAESEEAIKIGQSRGLNVIAGNHQCVLVSGDSIMASL